MLSGKVVTQNENDDLTIQIPDELKLKIASDVLAADPSWFRSIMFVSQSWYGLFSKELSMKAIFKDSPYRFINEDYHQHLINLENISRQENLINYLAKSEKEALDRYKTAMKVLAVQDNVHLKNKSVLSEDEQIAEAIRLSEIEEVEKAYRKVKKELLQSAFLIAYTAHFISKFKAEELIRFMGMYPDVIAIIDGQSFIFNNYEQEDMIKIARFSPIVLKQFTHDEKIILSSLDNLLSLAEGNRYIAFSLLNNEALRLHITSYEQAKLIQAHVAKNRKLLIFLEQINQNESNNYVRKEILKLLTSELSKEKLTLVRTVLDKKLFADVLDDVNLSRLRDFMLKNESVDNIMQLLLNDKYFAKYVIVNDKLPGDDELNEMIAILTKHPELIADLYDCNKISLGIELHHYIENVPDIIPVLGKPRFF